MFIQKLILNKNNLIVKQKEATLPNVVQIGAGEPNITIKFICINTHFILSLCSIMQQKFINEQDFLSYEVLRCTITNVFPNFPPIYR